MLTSVTLCRSCASKYSCWKFIGIIFVSFPKDYSKQWSGPLALINFLPHVPWCCLCLECISFGYEHSIYITLSPLQDSGILAKEGVERLQEPEVVFFRHTGKLHKWTYPSCSNIYRTNKIQTKYRYTHGSGHRFPPLAEELLVIDSCGEWKS